MVLLLGPPGRLWTGTAPLLAVVDGALTLFGVLDLPIDVAGFLAPVQGPIQAGDTMLLTALALYIICIPLALVTGLGRSLSWSALQHAPGLPERPVHRLQERLTLGLVLVVGILLLTGLWIFAVRSLPLATSK